MINKIYNFDPAFGQWCCKNRDFVANVSKEPVTSHFLVKE
jgi:hypothetical protein